MLDNMEINMEDKKICVVGLGGVGGFIGGALAKMYSHVSFFARGLRKESIQKKGLIIKSEYMGNYQVMPEHLTDKSEDLGIMDYVFISVKNYSLEQVCKQIAPMIGEKTVVIPIMNGIDPADRTRNYLGCGIVLDALIYIVSGSEEDFTIVQKGKYTTVHIGRKNATDEEKKSIVNVHNILDGAGVECVIDEDIEAVIWKKYVLNCAYNILTAYYSATTGELRNDPQKVQEFLALLTEACLVGRKNGVNLPEGLEEEHFHHFKNVQAEDATSSLRRDMDLGKPNELETFSGYLLAIGKVYGLNLPVTEHFYNQLKEQTKA